MSSTVRADRRARSWKSPSIVVGADGPGSPAQGPSHCRGPSKGVGSPTAPSGAGWPKGIAKLQLLDAPDATTTGPRRSRSTSPSTGTSCASALRSCSCACVSRRPRDLQDRPVGPSASTRLTVASLYIFPLTVLRSSASATDTNSAARITMIALWGFML